MECTSYVVFWFWSCLDFDLLAWVFQTCWLPWCVLMFALCPILFCPKCFAFYTLQMSSISKDKVWPDNDCNICFLHPHQSQWVLGCYVPSVLHAGFLVRTGRLPTTMQSSCGSRRSVMPLMLALENRWQWVACKSLSLKTVFSNSIQKWFLVTACIFSCTMNT